MKRLRFRPESQRTVTALSVGLLFWITLSFCFWIYWPGLYGTILLDDMPNLKGLADITFFNTSNEILAFLQSGHAGPLGRPVSLLTFALQHEDWPLNPYNFKYINLLIHLLLGCGIFLFFSRLLRLADYAPQRQVLFASLAITAIWLLHPIQVSTVLYVIQRMTQLSALFTVLGLLFFVMGRQWVQQGKTFQGLLSATLGIAGFGLLAVFSKENGALIVVYALVIEHTLLAGKPANRYWHIWRGVFLYTPILLGGMYVLVNFESMVLAAYGERDFTLWQRLLTESRILADYAAKIIVPIASGYGLYFDHYPLSTGLFSPITTVITLFAHAALLSAAFVFRRRLPAFSFGVFWFYGGHLLESTIFSLELYFEHRNYLPLLGPVFLAVYLISSTFKRLTDPMLKPLTAAAVGLLAVVYPAVTYQETNLWGSPIKQAFVWAEERPDSVRARTQPVIVYFEMRSFQAGMELLHEIRRDFPKVPNTDMLWLLASCYDTSIGRPPYDELVTKIVNSKPQPGVVVLLERIVSEKERGNACREIDNEALKDLVRALRDKTYSNYLKREMHIYLGRLTSAEGNLAEAMRFIDEAFAMGPSADLLLTQAIWQANFGRIEKARQYLYAADDYFNRNPSVLLSNKHRLVMVEQHILHKEIQYDGRNNEKNGGAN